MHNLSTTPVIKYLKEKLLDRLSASTRSLALIPGVGTQGGQRRFPRRKQRHEACSQPPEAPTRAPRNP